MSSQDFTPSHPFLSGSPLTCEAGRGDALCRCINVISMVAALMEGGESFFSDPSARDGVIWTLEGVRDVLSALLDALGEQSAPKQE